MQNVDASQFHDRYVDALKDLIDRKRKSKTGKVTLDTEEKGGASRGSNVIDLMAALKKSLDKPAADAAPAKAAPAKKAPARKPAARKPTPAKKRA